MTLRRLLLAFYSLVFLAACGGLVALTWAEDQMLDIEVGDFNLQAFIVATNAAQAAVTTILAVLIVFGLWTLLLAVLPAGGATGGMLRLKQAEGGTVEVSAQTLERLVRGEIEALPEVRQAVPRVRVSGGAVATDATVVIDPSASIAQITSDVKDAITRAFREQVGVTEVKRPNIRISYDTIKGEPVNEPRARVEPSQSASPPAQSEGQVSWPPPPPDVRSSGRAAEEEALVPPAPEAATEQPDTRESHD